MSRTDELRATLARCEDRARYAERELERYTVDADLRDAEQERRRRKLKNQWELAARDLEWCREQLGRRR